MTYCAEKWRGLTVMTYRSVIGWDPWDGKKKGKGRTLKLAGYKRKGREKAIHLIKRLKQLL